MPRSPPKSANCRIYPALLVLCYLEVVLWTTCLLLSCVPASASEAANSHNYLLREKGNLQQAHCSAGPTELKSQQIPRALIEQAIRAEHCRVRQLQAANCIVAQDALQPGLTLLRIYQEASGVPAPYAGIHAIS